MNGASGGLSTYSATDTQSSGLCRLGNAISVASVVKRANVLDCNSGSPNKRLIRS